MATKKPFDATALLPELMDLGLAIGACLEKGMTKKEVLASCAALLVDAHKWQLRRGEA